MTGRNKTKQSVKTLAANKTRENEINKALAPETVKAGEAFP